MTGLTLVAGAGYTGRRVAGALATGGKRVAVASRTPPRIDGATALVFDADDPSAAARLAERLPDPATSLLWLIPPDRTAAEAADCDPRLDRVLEALGETLERVVLASTTGVYGDQAGREVTEHTPTAPRTARAVARVGAERTLQRHAAGTGIECCILRIAGIYGPDRLMLSAIAEGQPVIRIEEAGPGNRIHVDDLATACAAALTGRDVPDIVNAADGDHTSSTAFARRVAELAGLPPPPEVDRSTAQVTFSPMRLSFLNESRRIVPDRLHALLGEHFAYPDHEAGIVASLKAMGRL